MKSRISLPDALSSRHYGTPCRPGALTGLYERVSASMHIAPDPRPQTPDPRPQTPNPKPPAILPSLTLDAPDKKLSRYFLPYQIRWIHDPSPMCLAEKSVRIGWTFADALKNVRKRLLLFPRASRTWPRTSFPCANSLPAKPGNSPRVCLKIESGPAAVDFGGGQGGEACASPQRAAMAEPTLANAKRRAEGPLSIFR